MTNMEWCVLNNIAAADLYCIRNNHKKPTMPENSCYIIKEVHGFVYSEFEDDATDFNKVILDWLADDYNSSILSKTDKKIMKNWLDVIHSFTHDNITSIVLKKCDAQGNILENYDDNEKVDGYYMIFNFEWVDSVKFFINDCNMFAHMNFNKEYTLALLGMPKEI